MLRGSSAGPNYDAATVAATQHRLAAAGLPRRVVIDASHGNSGKDHRRQPLVVADVAERVAGGEAGVVGIMLDSFLAAGRQDLVLGRSSQLTYGISVTDACMGWDATVTALEVLATAVAGRGRRGCG